VARAAGDAAGGTARISKRRAVQERRANRIAAAKMRLLHPALPAFIFKANIPHRVTLSTKKMGESLAKNPTMLKNVAAIEGSAVPNEVFKRPMLMLLICAEQSQGFCLGLIQAPHKVGGPRFLRAGGAGQGASHRTPRALPSCSSLNVSRKCAGFLTSATAAAAASICASRFLHFLI
jgi:hypothetical protein